MVELQRRLQAVSMAELANSIETMGQLVAWAQLRNAGREGSVTADALIAFGADPTWQDNLLSASEASASAVAQ